MHTMAVGIKVRYHTFLINMKNHSLPSAMPFSVFIPSIVVAAVLAGAPAFAAGGDSCLACHGEKGAQAPYVDDAQFSVSVHSGNGCSSCHEGKDEYPHKGAGRRVSCRGCHPDQTTKYLASDHGKALSRGVPEAAKCVDCHGGSHNIKRVKSGDSSVSHGHVDATCAKCHGDTKKMAKFNLSVKAPSDTYNHTVHGMALRSGNAKAATCTDCHGKHDINLPTNPKSRTHWTAITGLCGRCHSRELAEFNRSIHGADAKAGRREAPLCTDCHGEHTIRAPKDPNSSVSSGAVTRTCLACHDSVRIVSKFGMPADRGSTFRDSYHGLAGRMGDLTVANCASCHGWHEVLPSSDKRSMVNSANLSRTCGRCHPNAKMALAAGKIHGGDDQLTRIIVIVYIFIILGTVLGCLFHNFIDLARKGRAKAPLGPLKKEDHILLTLRERIQHFALLTSFLTLAYSGFALRFPNSWFVSFLVGMQGEAARRMTHRAAAVVFVVLAVYHLYYLLATNKGRERLKALLPAPRDLSDPIKLVLYNLGLRRERPLLERFSYIEKFEYWALVWGSIVMVVTGAILIFHNFALASFPYWVVSVARIVHLMEAILACLAIVVWHFYWVIFDPDIYPMNTAWLDGKAKPPKGGH